MATRQEMPKFFDSAIQFISGILRRWYYWAFAILLDPLELYNKFVMPQFPDPWQKEYQMPSVVGFIALFVLILWAAVCTYHELRKQNQNEINTVSNERDKLKKEQGESESLFEIRQALGALCNEANDIILADRNTDNETRKAMAHDWREKTAEVLKMLFGPVQERNFRTMGNAKSDASGGFTLDPAPKWDGPRGQPTRFDDWIGTIVHAHAEVLTSCCDEVSPERLYPNALSADTLAKVRVIGMPSLTTPNSRH